MRRPTRTGFWRNGDWRDLHDPEGETSGAQLRWLNRLGMLELVSNGQAEPLTKGEAAYAIDEGGRGSREDVGAPESPMPLTARETLATRSGGLGRER
jgi:hypothetical protein